MRRRGVVSASFVFAFFLHGIAAEPTKGLGLFAGLMSGSGFSYRQMGRVWGYQLTFGLYSSGKKAYTPPAPVVVPYRTDGGYPDLAGSFVDEGKEIELSGNLGINGYRILHYADRSIFYLLFGLADYGTYTVTCRQKIGVSDHTDSTYTWGPVGPVEHVKQWKDRIYWGAGLGFLWKITPNVRIGFEWPIVATSGGEVRMWIPQAGIHYFFR